ncbi:putative reverse transcriptase domain-containing protein [Tanacetum coccineum]
MDKSWMRTSRTKKQYIDGVEAFIKYVVHNLQKMRNIDPRGNKQQLMMPCPCTTCLNHIEHKVEEVQFHLFKYGIDLSYTKWDKHREKDEQATTAQIPVNATTEFLDDTDFNMDFGLEIPTDGPATVEMVNATKESFDEDDLAKFQELLLDVEKPLYKGCPDFTKLSAIVKLLNLKGKYGASDKFFTELLGLLKKMLPAGNEMVEKTYQAKKLMRMMGSGYKKIHAWRTIDEKFSKIAKDPRNLRLGILADGVDINSGTRHHSVWPVLSVIYNLPPRLCMKRKFIMLSLAPNLLTGEQIYKEVQHIENKWGKGKRTNNKTSENQEDTRGRGGKIQKQKRKTTDEEGSSNQVNEAYWKKFNICYRKLKYWRHNSVPHYKDGMNARLDLAELGIKPELFARQEEDKTTLPPAGYTLTNAEKDIFCETLSNIRVPQGYCSNVSSLVSLKDRKLIGLKSHDYHMLMQEKEIILPELDKLQLELVMTPCLLEKFFPLCMKVIKGHVRNRNRPEGCIAEETIAEETIECFIEYHKTMKTIGIPPDKHVTNENEDRKPLSAGKSSEVSGEVFQKAHFNDGIVYQNSGVSVEAVDLHISKEVATIRKAFYYGVLQEIWVLDYRFRQIPLFKCDWVNHKAGGVKHDPNLGYTLVDLNSLGHKDDSFILVSQARQVFYVKDQIDKKLSIVFRTPTKNYKDTYDEVDEEFSTVIHEHNDNILPRVNRRDLGNESQNDYYRTDCEGLVDVFVYIIDADQELAARMTLEEHEKYTFKERARMLAEFIKNRKKQLTVERAKAIRSKPPTKDFEEIQGLYNKEKELVDTFVPIRSEEDERRIKDLNTKAEEESSNKDVDNTNKRKKRIMMKRISKKKKADADLKEEEQIKTFLSIVPNEEEVIDYEVLDKRYQIVDWKSEFYHNDRYGEPHDYYRVFRADGSSRYIKTFTEMVSRFDRMDFLELHIDELWKNQEDWILKSWNLYENCGVHILMLEDGTEFHMLAERKYPLTKETLEKMLVLRLTAESESEAAFDLLRFIQKQIDEM